MRFTPIIYCRIKNIQSIRIFVVLFPLLLGGNELRAQTGQSKEVTKDTLKPVFDAEHILFGSNDLMQVTLRFDIEEFISKRYDPKYMDAEITLRFNQSDSLKQRIKIKPSGEFRRTFCLFPPIHLNFKGSDLLGNEPGEQHTIKLVTHCKNPRSYAVYVLREYLTYRMYNIISPYSLKVRLLNINYIDKHKPKNKFTRFGFLIENSNSMAERTNTVLQKDAKYSRENILMDQITRVAVFEYMIGNTDWAASVLHNIKLLELPDGHRIYVPHDYDYSGFVGTNYAIPDPTLGINDVKERLYTGKCVSDDIFLNVLSEFDGYKNEFYNLILNFDLLDKREKKETLAYIDEFYTLLKNKPALINRIKSACKDYIH